MEELKFNAAGTDAVYLANVNMFFTTLFPLSIFQKNWPEDRLGSQSVLAKAVDWYRQMFEGGLTGNRIHIAARKSARQELDVRIQKILHYVVAMAEESEMVALVNSGVVKYKTRKKSRKTAKAAVAS